MRCQTILRLLPILLLISIPTISLAQSAAWQGQEKMIDGSLHVQNPGEPAQPPQTIAGRELWRVGGSDDEDEEIIGQITDIEIDEEGNAYLLDGSLNVVKIYSPTGEFQRDIGREGEGPGEWRHATQLIFMPGGNVGVIRGMPSKVIQLDRQGGPAGTFDFPDDSGMGMGVIRKAAAGADYLVLSILSPTLRDGGIVTVESLSGYDLEGNRRFTLLEESSRSEGGRLEVTLSNPKNFSTYWTLAADGRLFVAPHYDEYQILVFGPDGSQERVIERDYRSVKQSAEAIANLEAGNEQLRAMLGEGSEMEIEPYSRDIGRLFARPDGELWVLSSAGNRDCTDDAVGIFDRFDRRGRYLQRLSVAADYNPDRDRFILTGDRLFVLKEARAAPTSMSESGGDDDGGGRMMMMQLGGGGGTEEDDAEEAAPFAVICYELPRTLPGD